MSAFNWVNFVLIIIIIIILIVIIIIYVNDRSNILSSGIALIVINGPTTGTADNFVMSGNMIYVNQSSSVLTLTVSATSDQAAGQLAYVKNNTSNNLIVVGGTANIDSNTLGNTITNGETAIYMATNSSNAWLRLS